MFGILGGTFDPIHEGHIQIACQVMDHLKLDRVDFIPCFQSPHRDHPIASEKHRLAMLKLALKNHPKFFVNEYEIAQQKISYSIDTVTYLRKQNPNRPICLILGGDAFAHFDQWREWQKILATVHLVVVTRNKITAPVNPLIQAHQTNNINDLHHALSGKIYFNNIKPIDISATQIRHDIRAGEKEIVGLNNGVLEYILKNRVY